MEHIYRFEEFAEHSRVMSKRDELNGEAAASASGWVGEHAEAVGPTHHRSLVNDEGHAKDTPGQGQQVHLPMELFLVV